MWKHSLLAVFVVCAIVVPVKALDTTELLAIGAMPLVVSEVAELDVPERRLVEFVSLLNDSDVPPVQFVEVVRYSPVALIDTSGGDRDVVRLVQVRRDSGLRGTALVSTVEDHYRTYYYSDPQYIFSPPEFVTVERHYVPVEVRTRLVTTAAPVASLDGGDLLAVALMPLVVNEVFDLGVPPNRLMDFVSLLNAREVRPVEFVEVVRYSPVVLSAPDPLFGSFLSTLRGTGDQGTTFVTVVERELRTIEPEIRFDPAPIRVAAFDQSNFFPPLVATRIRSSHPHGGPPGQLKKIAGVKTGAEIVHGTHPGRDRDTTVTTRRESRPTVTRRDRDDRSRATRVEKPRKAVKQNRGKDRVEIRQPVQPSEVRVVKPNRGHGGQGGGNPNKGHGGGNNKGGGNKGSGGGKGKGK